MSLDGPSATLIGDVIGSRRLERSRLQRELIAVLESVNDSMNPVMPLELSLGDEFQGVFASVADALLASLLVRLELLFKTEGADSRYGVGYGEISVFERTRFNVSKDGPGWWAARSAIERATSLAESPRTAFVRTCASYWPEAQDAPTECAASTDAFLMCRDAFIERMSKRQRRLLLGLLRGRTQSQLADEEGVSQAAVSQNLGRSGAFVIKAAHDALTVPTE